MHLLGTGVPRRLGVARSALSPTAAQALGCSLTLVSGSRLAGSPAWHGLPQCPDYGHWVSYCCVAFVLWSGLCWGLGFGNPASPGWGLWWVCLGRVGGFAPLFPAGVRGVVGWAWVSARTPPVLVRVGGRAWLCARSSCSLPFPVPVCGVGACVGVRVADAPGLSLGRCGWDVRAVVCVPRLPPPFLGGRLWRGGVRVLPLVQCAPPPSPLVFFCCFGLCGVGRWLSRSCVSWSLSPDPFSPRPRCLLFVFFFLPFPRWAAAFGLLLPVLAGWSAGALLGSPVFGAVWVGGLAASCGVGEQRGGCGPFSPHPPTLLLSSFWGGSVCSSLCLPWTGARTGRHSVWFSGLLLVVAFCQAMLRPHGSGGLCTCWARRPFLPG